MHTEWKDFTVGKLRCNCSQCAYFQTEAQAEPCSSCIVKRTRRGRDFVEVTGDKFVPANPEYFANLQAIFEQYNDRLCEISNAHAAIKKEIAEAAKERGVAEKDFYYARQPASLRLDEYFRRCEEYEAQTIILNK